MSCYDKRSRTGEFDNGIPRYVETSLQEGWTITQKCLLAWTPMPLASNQYQIRALILVLETTFTLFLWAMKSRDKGYYMPVLCPWPRHSLPYDGCCSHHAISEKILGQKKKMDTTPEETNRLAVETKRIRDRQHSKAYRDKAFEEQRHQCTLCNLFIPQQRKASGTPEKAYTYQKSYCRIR